jgi:AAA+ ATPase superfamily predicted ATPase
MAVLLASCTEMLQVMNQFTQNRVIGGVDITSGLKEALNNGISKLTATDGFYRNEAVKILLPEGLRKIDAGLRRIGLSSLADKVLKVLNRTVEDAVKDVRLIVIDAVRNMTFMNVKSILMGNQSSATIYL